MLRETVAGGHACGEIVSDVDGTALATRIIGTLEGAGAVMLARLYGDTIHMHRATGHLPQHIAQLSAHASAAYLFHWYDTRGTIHL